VRSPIFLVALVLALCGCEDFPKDANRTLERIRGGEPLRVGWVRAEPWVRLSETGEPAGIEPDLIRAWAEGLSVRIEWVSGSETQLVTALQENAIDLAVAGLTADAPWGAKIGQTQPYLTTEVVVGISASTLRPQSWHGVEIRYDRRRPHFAGLIRSIGARPVPAEPGQLGSLAAAYAQELSGLGLVPADKFAKEQRVIATAPAENALTLALDRFLHARSRSIKERLAAEARS
jgi:polar amino acid transport system substrate-binding protein